MRNPPFAVSHRFPHTKPRIDIYIASTGADSPQLSSDHLNIVSNEEREKSASFRLFCDRRRYLLSRILLRLSLSHAAAGKVEPQHWKFDSGAAGKPCLAKMSGLPRLNFSLSHSNQLSVVAVSSLIPAGVDVEFLNPTGDADELASLLAAGERLWLRSRPKSTRFSDLLRLWTLKEAYVKLLGCGLRLDPASFEIALDPPRVVRGRYGESHPEDVRLSTRQIDTLHGSYQISLAAEAPSCKKIEESFFFLNCISPGVQQAYARHAG